MIIECNTVYNMDCLEGMKHIPDKSIDMILCDLPYGTTPLEWDTIIPMDKLWRQYERIAKPAAAIILTAIQPFTTQLIASNMKIFKYNLVWGKAGFSGFAHAHNMPLKSHEDICIFSKSSISHESRSSNRMNYYPQGLLVANKITANGNRKQCAVMNSTGGKKYIQKWTNYPKSILKFARDRDGFHPTQKPLSLWEYLIKTYSKEGDIVLDNCMGSFTTAIAAENTKRQWIGFEKDAGYCELGGKRIRENRMRLDILNRAYQRAKECQAKKLESA